MPAPRSLLAPIHRWLALALAPVILAILISGAILTFRPILGGGTGGDGAGLGPPVNPAQVVALVDRVDPQGATPFVVLQDDHRTLTFVRGRGDQLSSYDIATGSQVATPPETPPDFFDKVLRIHKDLWFGAGGLVTLGSLALIVIVLAGPLLAGPRRAPRTVLGWHIRTGWLLWPLLALLPVSLVMMKLHPPVFSRGPLPALTVARAVELAARTEDLSQFRGVQVIRGTTAILVTERAGGVVRYVVQGGRVRPLESWASRIGKEVHEGTWAGRWSGLLNLASVGAMLGMMLTGTMSWWRRRRRAGRAGAPAAAAAADYIAAGTSP